MKTKTKDSKIKVLLLITGSIAAVRIPLLVSQLAKENYEIRCVLSKNAEKLIPCRKPKESKSLVTYAI